jgi:phospholipid N-methyltransferase
MLVFTSEEKRQVRKWLQAAFTAAKDYDASARAEKKLFEPLSLFDHFARTRGDTPPTPASEQKIIEISYPDRPPDMPVTVDGFLDLTSVFYTRLKNANSTPDFWTTLENSGAIIQKSEKIFVKTDEQSFQPAASGRHNSYTVKTEPRLAMLIEHLRNEGINGKSIYTDNLVITRGTVSKDMMRTHPYHIVQIPHLDMEVAVCDQIGETTFAKKGTVGPVFWDSLTKDQLKAREDVIHVDRHNDRQWWNEIASFLSGHSDPKAEPINLKSWIKKPFKLDLELVKTSLLVHRLITGKWISQKTRGIDDKKSSYVLEYGPYATQLKVQNLEHALRAGGRGLPGGLSIAQLNKEISQEHGLDYKNHLAQEDLDLQKIKKSLLSYHEITGKWLANTKNLGSNPMLEYGLYAGNLTIGALNVALSKGMRGLPGGSSIAQLNEEISKEHGLDYKNHLAQEDLDLEKIKESLLAHRKATGKWLSNGAKGPDNKIGSYLLEHGPYAGRLTARSLVSALSRGTRGLPGGSSIAQLNAEISKKLGLDYVNIQEQEDLDLEKIKESLLAYRKVTGKWLPNGARWPDNKIGSYVLEYGPYAGQLTTGAIDQALSRGRRGLPGNSSIAKLNSEISEEQGLDYINLREQEDLDLEKIKKSLLAHHKATGKWLSAHTSKGPDDKNGSYILEYGPYAGQLKTINLEACLRLGLRGLPGGSSISKLNMEISKEYDLDYINLREQENLDLEKIKESLLAHRKATGKWLSAGAKTLNGTRGSYILEHGPYAGQLTAQIIDHALSRGHRGLSRGSSIAQLNEEISKEYRLDYKNHLAQENLDLEKIKESLLAHRKATGKWLSNGAKGPDNKIGSYVLEHGPYAGQLTVRIIEHALSRGQRGLPGGSSIAQLNAGISEKQGLDYINVRNQENLDLKKIKESLLAHWQKTGKWLSNSTKAMGGNPGSYVLEHGPYAGKININALNMALSRGGRGLPSGSSIAQLNAELKRELEQFPASSPPENSF